MARYPLTVGAYSARSIIASAQRSVNLYPEKNLPGSVSPQTYYCAPGLRRLTQPTKAPGRGLYLSSQNILYYCSGSTIYTVNSDFVTTPVYTFTSSSSGRVSFADNGTEIVMVDGTPSGYFAQVNDPTTWAPISAATNSPPTDPTDPGDSAVYAFYGSNRVDIMDGFFIFAQPGTANFYCTYEDEVVFDATYFASKNGYSDKLVSLMCCQRFLYLFGEFTTELWIDAGGATFPFAIQNGVFIQNGLSAANSLAQIGGTIFFLSQNLGGQNVAMKLVGVQAQVISTQAISYEWSGYGTTSDATGFCFLLDGHTYYQINFPSADRSWRYDETTEEWAEVPYVDSDGVEHRHLLDNVVFAYDTIVGYSSTDGSLYALDPTVSTDLGQPMIWRRGWPHMMGDNVRVQYQSFTLDADVGGVPNLPLDDPPTFWLRYSDTRGATWTNPVMQSLGASGQYATSPTIRRLGQARDRVFEAFGTIPGPSFAINGAFIDATPNKS